MATARYISLFHIRIHIKVHWISAHTHNFKKYNWDKRSMSRIVDVLEEKMKKIERLCARMQDKFDDQYA